VERYGPLTARCYDLLSGEPVYGVGRRLAVAALDLRAGERVLDIGCGTGLNLPALARAVGPTGSVVGLDRSPAMLAAARRRPAARGATPVRLVRGDLTASEDLRSAAGAHRFDAAIATYALSLLPDVDAAWAALRGVLVTGARVAVVDMARPSGAWSWTGPLARLACRLGGADIDAHPHEVVGRDLTAVRGWARWGGHVQVRVGTL
jgi:S-adenosylmethionine-diacylgycerolhomoserine-N-methlytransferase